jgi:hypothetical protein
MKSKKQENESVAGDGFGSFLSLIIFWPVVARCGFRLAVPRRKARRRLPIALPAGMQTCIVIQTYIDNGCTHFWNPP